MLKFGVVNRDSDGFNFLPSEPLFHNFEVGSLLPALIIATPILSISQINMLKSNNARLEVYFRKEYLEGVRFHKVTKLITEEIFDSVLGLCPFDDVVPLTGIIPQQRFNFMTDGCYVKSFSIDVTVVINSVRSRLRHNLDIQMLALKGDFSLDDVSYSYKKVSGEFLYKKKVPDIPIDFISNANDNVADPYVRITSYGFDDDNGFAQFTTNINGG